MKAPTPTLFSWMESWMQTYVCHRVEVSTAENYRCHVNLLHKWLPDRELSQLMECDIQALINLLADLGYSKSSLKKVLLVLRQAYDCAVRNRFVSDNPAKYVEIPKSAPERTIFPLTIKQQARLELTCYDDRYGHLFIFLLYTGLRRSELRNLKWTDFDAEKKTIHVRKSKTKAGIRILPLLPLPLLIITLQPHINEYIFNSMAGTPITPYILRRTYYRLRQKAEIPTLTNHVCRHTFATRLLEQGAAPKAISSLMGHTNVAFTLNRYVKATEPEYLAQQIYLLEPLSTVSAETKTICNILKK